MNHALNVYKITEKWRAEVPGLRLYAYADNNRMHDYIGITYLFIPLRKRERGIGTAIMNELCMYADEHKIPMYLTPTNKLTRKTDIVRLEKWYQSFGFKSSAYARMMFSETHEREPQPKVEIIPELLECLAAWRAAEVAEVKAKQRHTYSAEWLKALRMLADMAQGKPYDFTEAEKRAAYLAHKEKTIQSKPDWMRQ